MFAFGGFWPFAFKALPSGLMHICDQGRFLVVFGGEDKSSIGWTAWWLWPHRMMMITIIVLWGAIEYLSRDSKRCCCMCFSVDWPSNWHIDRKTILPKKTPTQKSLNRAEEVQWFKGNGKVATCNINLLDLMWWFLSSAINISTSNLQLKRKCGFVVQASFTRRFDTFLASRIHI